MKIIRTCLAALLAATAVSAMAQQPAPFAQGDPHKGEKLVTKDCESCHASKFGGDANAIYLRKDRRVKSASQLLSQVTMCNTQLNSGFFPDDEKDVAAYLNQRYYHFEP
ncbi:MAG TPA: cytochrome c [Casimicrobiaceae bacterium]|nr:cytochrome c [Casimicrobiaceae bacterium]